MPAITEPSSVFRKPFKPEESVSEFHETDSKNAREISEAGFGRAQGFELRVDPSFWKDHNVQVIIRLRPLNCSEISLQGQNRCVRQDSCQALTWIGHPESRFTFDLVADEYVSQEKLFKEAGVPMVENCMAGYNSCIFAYGQTGSGKTHTMLGDIEGGIQKSSANCGMTLRVFEYLFSRIHKEKDIQSSQKLHFTCRCSFLEIYNEHIFDLLDPSSTNLQVREDAKKGVHVENLKEFEVSSPTDVIQQLIQGAANRKVASTNMNHASSRSHSVFTCVIERKWESQGVTHHRFARLNLVDLAGSERQKSSGAEGDRLKEATNINKSLSTLGLVIMNLVTSSSKRQLHVPYRDSKLTFLLQDSLGGNSKTMIIANISPSSCCAFETLSTLKFAQRAKFIRNNAIVNEEASGDVLTLRLEIQHLKKEVNRLRGLCNGGFDNLESDTITESIQGSPAILKLNGDQILYSPLTFDKRLSPRKEYEAALVSALRRIHDKEEELKALAAERNVTDQMVIQQTKEISSLKLTLRFREDAIKRLEGLASSKISPEAHISQEREALIKEIEVLRNHVDRSSEVTKFARENVQLREELKRLKSFVEDGERERIEEQITVLQDKLLEALDWKLMHEKNSEDHALFSWDSSVNEENEFLHLEAIQNQREAEALRKNLTICLEAKERLERRVDELTAQLDVEQKKADSQRQESQLLNPVVVSDHPMELKTMVDAITAAINREAEARETAITLARENEELHMKLKNMYEDNTKLINLYESTDIKTTSDETGVTYQDDHRNIHEDKKAEDLEQQLREMLEENEKLLGLYEKAMQERDDFKRMLASYELATMKAKDEGINCPEKLVEEHEGNGLSKEVLGSVLLKLDPIYKIVKISGLIEKAAYDVEAIYRKFEELDHIALHKMQEIKALSLPLSELEEKKTIANNKLLALKTVLERFSSKFDDCEERDVSAKYRYESCLGSWEQKNKELQRFRFLKGETDAGFTKAKQFEAELRNNLDQLKLQLQVTETQRKENERVLLSIDNLNPSESRTLSFGKATELLKSEENRTKLGMEMKKLREKLASIQKDLAKLRLKSESLSFEIENVEAELAIESTVLQESEFACGRIAEEKQAVCSMIEDGMVDFGRILVEYQECIFHADLKKCEIELLEDELKLEMKQMEELKSGQKVALENLRILMEDSRYRLAENDLDDSASEIKRLLSSESCHF